MTNHSELETCARAAYHASGRPGGPAEQRTPAERAEIWRELPEHVRDHWRRIAGAVLAAKLHGY
jgi:hypothetical protein